MRSIVMLFAVTASFFAAAIRSATAETEAEVVATSLVWDKAKHVDHPDLIRFGERWFLACQESQTPGYPGGRVRVLTSTDAKVWESATAIESPTPKRGLFGPSLTVTPGGQLMVSAGGLLPYPNSPNPLPEYGGLSKTLTWVSKDGRTWEAPSTVGLDEFPLGRIVWHRGAAFSPAIGRICGSAQTLHVMASKDGKAFESRSDSLLRGLMPYDGELLFEGNKAYCVVTGHSKTGATGLLGVAEMPYQDWQWKELDQRIRLPKFLRLPDDRVLATVGLYDRKVRTSLCEFHPTTGKFTELLELPAGKQVVSTSLAWHDGHVWVSYPVVDGDESRVHLAQVKLK